MRGESAEYRLRSLEVPEHRVAEHHVAVSRLPARLGTGFGAGSREVDESVRVGHRERTKQDLIEERKDGGIGPDAEREGNDRDAGDERGLEEGAEGEGEMSHPGPAPEGLGGKRQLPCQMGARGWEVAERFRRPTAAPEYRTPEPRGPNPREKCPVVGLAIPQPHASSSAWRGGDLSKLFAGGKLAQPGSWYDVCLVSRSWTFRAPKPRSDAAKWYRAASPPARSCWSRSS